MRDRGLQVIVSAVRCDGRYVLLVADTSTHGFAYGREAHTPTQSDGRFTDGSLARTFIFFLSREVGNQTDTFLRCVSGLRF